MAKYTFKFEADAGLSLMKGYKFNMNLPGDGAIKQYIGGQVMKAAFSKADLEAAPDMSVGLKDWYGRKVFSDLILKIGNDTVEFMNALITVEHKKNIVTTAIQGRTGSVFEFISNAPYDVTIEGILTGTGEQYPKSEVKALAGLFAKTEIIDATSEYLQLFDIYQLICRSAKLNQGVASEGHQAFYLNFYSYEAIDLVLE